MLLAMGGFKVDGWAEGWVGGGMGGWCVRYGWMAGWVGLRNGWMRGFHEYKQYVQ